MVGSVFDTPKFGSAKGSKGAKVLTLDELNDVIGKAGMLLHYIKLKQMS